MERLKVLLIDQKKNTVTVELDAYLLKKLEINSENIHKHSSRRSLDREITNFLTIDK